MKRKMQQDKIKGWRLNTVAQWATIQAYSLTLPHVSNRAGLWETNTPHSECFTESLNFLLNDIAKKNKEILADRLSPQPVAAADPAPTTKDLKLPQNVRIKDILYILIHVLQVSLARSLSVSG